MPAPLLILASTSPYRRDLLQRLSLPFEVARPEVDETPLSGELPPATAARLAVKKAQAVAAHYGPALIIGSDQVAHRGGLRFDKPLTSAKAIEQLHAMSGKAIVFHTAVCVLNSATGEHQLENIPTEVKFRELSHDEIVRYVEREQPLDCAGSAKAEGLGISLLEHIRGDDPTALIGLPLIAVSRMLRAEGVFTP